MLQLSCDESDCQWRQLVLMSNRIFIYTIIKLLSSCSSSSILIQIYTPDIANMILSYSWGGWEYLLKTRGLPPQQSPLCAQGHSMSSRFWECLDLSMCICRHQCSAVCQDWGKGGGGLNRSWQWQDFERSCNKNPSLLRPEIGQFSYFHWPIQLGYQLPVEWKGGQCENIVDC